ncbi:hypothetical protein ACH5RR_008701 [Cinchona calisaya]|uniref:Uncharacterized protein n=1 Tax=Cinchona calisaya TaxID=153742 RepID=A0ABD3ACB9_9GENT
MDGEEKLELCARKQTTWTATLFKPAGQKILEKSSKRATIVVDDKSAHFLQAKSANKLALESHRSVSLQVLKKHVTTIIGAAAVSWLPTNMEFPIYFQSDPKGIWLVDK